ILNLRNREDHVREQAPRGLEKLGTNGTDAKSALLECARLERVASIRVHAINCLKALSPTEEQMLPLVKECLTDENESVACAVVGGLIPLAERSQDRYVELLSLAKKHRNSGVRNTSESGVYDIMRKHPEMFVQCLSNPQVEV